MIVLFLEDLILRGKFLNEVSSWVLLVHQNDQLLDISVELVLLRVLAVDGLKSIIVESICTEHFDDLELALHLLDDVFLEVDLHGLLTQLLEHIVEHHFLHVAVRGNSQGHDLPVSERGVFLVSDALFEGDQSTTFFFMGYCQVHEQTVKIAHFDVTSALLVVV